jgi:hypothetical protein
MERPTSTVPSQSPPSSQNIRKENQQLKLVLELAVGQLRDRLQKIKSVAEKQTAVPKRKIVKATAKETTGLEPDNKHVKRVRLASAGGVLNLSPSLTPIEISTAPPVDNTVSSHAEERRSESKYYNLTSFGCTEGRIYIPPLFFLLSQLMSIVKGEKNFMTFFRLCST